jgi:hypothetical protein
VDKGNAYVLKLGQSGGKNRRNLSERLRIRRSADNAWARLHRMVVEGARGVYWGNHPRGRLPRRPATTPCSLGAPSAVGLKALRLRVYFLKPRPVGMGLNGWCCPKLRLRAWINTTCYHCHLSLNTQSSTPSLSLAVHPNINPYANAKLALKDRALGKPCSATYRTAF